MIGNNQPEPVHLVETDKGVGGVDLWLDALGSDDNVVSAGLFVRRSPGLGDEKIRAIVTARPAFPCVRDDRNVKEWRHFHHAKRIVWKLMDEG